jgi:LmbE family N-acetylglucosaminyl deacetylase
MSLLASAGARLRLVAVTDGEASHPGTAGRDELAERRVAETAAALLALGADAAEVVRLRLPDSGLAGRQDEITALLPDLTDGFDICLAPWAGDAHADHEAVGTSARRATRQLAFYPVWAWHWAFPGDRRVPWRGALRVPLPPAVAVAKRAAIRCFASQLENRAGTGPVLTAGTLAHFARDAEVLFPVRQP